MSLWTNRSWGPMLLEEVEKPFNSHDYLYELKLDGIRVIIFVSKNHLTILSRHQNNLTNLYPELSSLKNMVTKNVIFDGEIIALDHKGYPSFSRLQERSRLKNAIKINQSIQDNPVYFIAFDIIYENKDLTNLPLYQRKEILDKYPNTTYFIKNKYIENDGLKLFQVIKKLDLEGIVAKQKNASYHINQRTDDFIKIKNIKKGKFVIGGYKINKRNMSLYLGEFKKDKLIYLGKCNLSLTNPAVSFIKENKSCKNCFYNLEDFQNLEDDVTYLKPQIYCYVEYTERTKNNHLRHPVFKELVGE